MSIDDLLEASLWDLFWLPPWASVVDRPELLYTRSDQDQLVLNMLLRVRAEAARIPALVEEVGRAHAGVRSRAMVAPGSRSTALDEAFHRGGWQVEALHHGYVTRPDASRWQIRPSIEVRAVADAATLRDAIAVSGLAFGREAEAVSEARIQDELGQCTGPDARVQRFVAYDSATQEPLSTGGLNLFPKLGLGFLWGGGTAPEGRGRGAYAGVVAARLKRAAEAGCGLVGVYAREGTSAPIVERQGFERHGVMMTWIREKS